MGKRTRIDARPTCSALLAAFVDATIAVVVHTVAYFWLGATRVGAARTGAGTLPSEIGLIAGSLRQTSIGQQDQGENADDNQHDRHLFGLCFHSATSVALSADVG